MCTYPAAVFSYPTLQPFLDQGRKTFVHKIQIYARLEYSTRGVEFSKECEKLDDSVPTYFTTETNIEYVGQKIIQVDFGELKTAAVRSHPFSVDESYTINPKFDKLQDILFSFVGLSCTKTTRVVHEIGEQIFKNNACRASSIPSRTAFFWLLQHYSKSSNVYSVIALKHIYSR